VSPAGFRRLTTIGIVIAATGLSACGSTGRILRPTQTKRSPPARLAGGTPVHVAVLLMENEEYGDVIGQGQTPYINALAHRYALATRMYGISHPSLPNYLALTGGSTAGITSDCTDCSVAGGGLAGQLQAHGISWRAYMEDLPRPCYQGASAGEYAKKHDPFIYYRRIASSPSACGRVVPFTALRSEMRAGSLPRFAWITPNLCHDMHDCSASTGDRFLAGLVPELLRALGPRGLLFLSWDEGTSGDGCCRLAAGGHIALIVAGAGARRGVKLGTPVDHYSVLQAIEDLFGLPRLGGAACACTPSLQPLLRTGGSAAG
jgi:hypothetical protein